MKIDSFIFHTKRHAKRKLSVWRLPLLYLIIFVQAPVAAEYLTDAAKKRKIDEMYQGYQKDFPTVKDFSAELTLEIMDRKKIILVDIRKTKEQAVSMITGAITETKFRRNLSAYRDYIVIGYCTIGSRSGKLASKLKKKGIRMFNMRGGILAWLHAGGIVHKDGKPVNRVHVYGRK
ncbi:MAG: rhodanese-like domain-containing protein [Thermodesulfobacteriota bacterium]|nr:rhodanese-like domain-containing protein [Thermodesulfobacteriota bacterium]